MNYNKKRGSVDRSFLLERKQRISIEDRGDLFIKNTQTQVRELYRRNVPKLLPQESCSQSDDILRTRLQVDALNKTIEHEIGKLKNFRHCFLQDLESKAVKKKQAPLKATDKHLTWSQNLFKNHTEISATKSPVPGSNRHLMHDSTISSPDSNAEDPHFCTMSVVSTSKSDDVKCNKFSDQNEKSKKKQPENERISGGCICDPMRFPCSVYHQDYTQTQPQIATCSCQTYGGVCQCNHNVYYEMQVPMPVPYPLNACNQHPGEQVCQQQHPAMQHQPYYSPLPQPTAARRTTDLNTNEFIRNLPVCPNPEADRPGRSDAKETVKSRPLSPRPKVRSTEKEGAKRTHKYPTHHQKSQRQDNFMKQQVDKSDASRGVKKVNPEKEIMIIKEYKPAKKPPSDSPKNQEQLRMYRKYIDLYKKEHDKTASKESILESRPTYTKLDGLRKGPLDKNTPVKLCPTYVKEPTPQSSGENYQYQQETGLNQISFQPDSRKMQEDDNRQIVRQETVVERSSRQVSREHSREIKMQDNLQNRNLCVKCNEVQESMSSCHANDVTQKSIIYSPRPNSVVIGGDLRAHPRQSPLTSNQTSQTSPHQPMTPRHIVSGYKLSQTQIQTGQKLITQTNAQSWRTLENRQASPEKLTHDQFTKMGQRSAIQKLSQNQTKAQTDTQNNAQTWRRLDNIQACPEKLTHDQYTKMGLRSAIQQPKTQQNYGDPRASNEPKSLGACEKVKHGKYIYTAQKGSLPMTNQNDAFRSANTVSHYENITILKNERNGAMKSLPHGHVPDPNSTENKACSPRNNCPPLDPRSDVRRQLVESTDEIEDSCNCTSSTYGTAAVSTDHHICEQQDCRNQFNVPVDSDNTQYTSFQEFPEVDSMQQYSALGNTQVGNDSVECRSNVLLSRQVHNYLPVSYGTSNRTLQGASNFELCDDSQNLAVNSVNTANLINQQPFSRISEVQCDLRYDGTEQGISPQQTSFHSTVCEKRKRLVTFADESAGFSEKSNTEHKCCRSFIDWERAHEDRPESDMDYAQVEIIAPAEINDYNDEDEFSFRSSSTAGTEFTCNESSREDEYVSCNESRTERNDEDIPPFSGCPCMYNMYLKYAALYVPQYKAD